MQIAGTRANNVTLKGPDTYHLPAWQGMSDPRRVSTLRKIVLEYGRDPRVATTTVNVLKQAGVEPREYKKQAAAILKWVQKNVYYVNEPGERLQSPEYTLRVGYGDCDDLSILLAAMYESIRLPWKFVLSGNAGGRTVRWVEGEPLPRGVKWSHIYVIVGRPTFTPTRWSYAEPSLKGVPLGWDVVQAKARGQRIPVPELGGLGSLGESLIDLIPRQKLADEWQQLRSELTEELHWRRIAVTSIVGAVTTISVTYLVEKIRTTAAQRRSRPKRTKRRRNGKRRRSRSRRR